MSLPLLLSVAVTTATDTQTHTSGLVFALAHMSVPPTLTPPLLLLHHTHTHTHTHTHWCWMTALSWPWRHLELIQVRGCWRCWSLSGAARWRTGSTDKRRSCSAFHSSPHIPPAAEALIKLFRLHTHPHIYVRTPSHAPPLVTTAAAAVLAVPRLFCWRCHSWLLKQTLSDCESKSASRSYFT